jgi:putative ABC transport system permease protein
MVAAVLSQAGWVGVTGTILALPIAWVLSLGAEHAGIRVLLPAWLLIGTAAITLAMALFSGVAGLRPLRRLEPATLLR